MLASDCEPILVKCCPTDSSCECDTLDYSLWLSATKEGTVRFRNDLLQANISPKPISARAHEQCAHYRSALRLQVGSAVYHPATSSTQTFLLGCKAPSVNLSVTYMEMAPAPRPWMCFFWAQTTCPQSKDAQATPQIWQPTSTSSSQQHWQPCCCWQC
jgi:hypothetical protein